MRDALDTLEGDVGTALGDAIVESVALAPDPEEAEKLSGGKPLFAILLLSDGANSIGREPLDVLDEAKEAGVPIYTIAFGTPDGTVEITNDFGVTQTYNVPPDPETLRRVAEETGGRFFEAPTEADLEEVYREIGSQVSYEDEKRELTAAFAGAGAFFLLLGGWRRLPEIGSQVSYEDEKRELTALRRGRGVLPAARRRAVRALVRTDPVTSRPTRR